MPKITEHGGPSNEAEENDGAHVTVQEPILPQDRPGEDRGVVEETADDNASDYDSLSLEELRNALGERGLSKTGNKPELAQRLEEDDAKSEQDETEV